MVICPNRELRQLVPEDWLIEFHQSRFGLTRSGDSLVLESPWGATERVSIPELSCGEVYARQPDGGELTVVATATPEASNSRIDASTAKPRHAGVKDATKKATETASA